MKEDREIVKAIDGSRRCRRERTFLLANNGTITWAVYYQPLLLLFRSSIVTQLSRTPDQGYFVPRLIAVTQFGC